MFSKLNFSYRRSNVAFTLIELVTALAVLGLLVVLLFQAFNSVSNLASRGSNQMEKNQVVRAVLQQIGRDLERTVSSASITNMYCSGANPIIGSSGISNSTLYFLSALTWYEGNTNGNNVVNVGYKVTNTTASVYGPAGNISVNKWVLQRGDDPNVNQTTPQWYTTPTNGNGYWKLFSDNVIGIAFQFYTNQDVSLTSWVSNTVPTSVGVKIWAIDSDNYSRALTLDPNLASAPALTIITNNVHMYTCRFFLPGSTQNP